MRVRVEAGQAAVSWNDKGDETGQYPQEVYVGGLHYQLRSEQELRDLYECLDFLFGKKT